MVGLMPRRLATDRYPATRRRQPYGDWEFEVKDPNGYVLVFSEPIP